MKNKYQKSIHKFLSLTADKPFCSLRIYHENNEEICVQRGVLQPISTSRDCGAMLVVHHDNGSSGGDGHGYGATCDLTPNGISKAYTAALEWAKLDSSLRQQQQQKNKEHASGRSDDLSHSIPQATVGDYRTPIKNSWEATPFSNKLELLQLCSQNLSSHSSIVDWQAALWHISTASFYISNQGSEITQSASIIAPQLSASCHKNGDTQTRSFGSYGYTRAGGMELIDRLDLPYRAVGIAKESQLLVEAKNCPNKTQQLLLAPDQMMLQIHESIGHPIELDRILGDERNYAGSSFVKKEMFGQYQYGSNILNITYDPTITDQCASYGYDDSGDTAQKKFLIKNGVLKAGLGGLRSQHRLKVDGVACSRSQSWNRPPIDRMANLNLEPGENTLEDMIAGVEEGVLMRTNRSWSIDHMRNKFQFGCEIGQLIKNGKLGKFVKNPNYRGISENFWRNLDKVGDTLEVLGTPFCGKGEPNQVVRVGHASPYALFNNIDIFGGA